MSKVTLVVNGKKVQKDVPSHTLLSTFLRLTSRGMPSVVKIFCVSLLINKKGG